MVKNKIVITGISICIFFSLFLSSVSASSRIEDARQIQQSISSNNLQSDRLAAAQNKVISFTRNGSPSPANKSAVLSLLKNEAGFITPTNGRFTSKFGWRDIGSGPEFHKGVDIANFVGTNVMAAAGGRVTFSGEMGGYGNVVMLSHNINGKVYATVYAHLSALNVSVGQDVQQGQSIGKMGNTGRSFGSHLHFEIHKGEWNGGRTNAVDPTQYISI